MAIDSMSTTAEDRSAARGRAREAHEQDRGVERPLAPSELFFSVTDEKGVITAGNQVFERVSGYRLEEMIGRAHNLVRHPEMPRAVFKILWDTIAAGEPVAAYVRNRTADGSYYWVLASVVPISGGYLSVRLAPSGEHFAIAKTVYEELRALERRIEGDDVRQRKPSIAASVARLQELLTQAGFESYHDFMRAALPAEVTRRAVRLQEAHREALSTVPPGASEPIVAVLAAYTSMNEFLTGLVTDLERYAEVGRALAEQSSYLRAMGNDVRLFALNAQIGASRLGEQGAALDAVARLLTRQSEATSPLVATVAGLAASAVSEIEDMTFELALSTIQAEMIAVFAHELAKEPEIHADSAANMLGLADALQNGSNRTFAALTTVSERLGDVVDHVGDVATGIDRLARLALNGRVELASVPDAGSISTLFSDVEKQVSDAKARLVEFETIREAARDLEAAAGNEAMSAAVRLREHAGQLAPSN